MKNLSMKCFMFVVVGIFICLLNINVPLKSTQQTAFADTADNGIEDALRYVF